VGTTLALSFFVLSADANANNVDGVSPVKSTIINVTLGCFWGFYISQPTVSDYHMYLVKTTFLPHV